MFSDDLLEKARVVLKLCEENGYMLATAESCTGGLISGCLTEIAGSSSVVERGFVTYTNRAKHELLGVPEDMLAEHGAVSEPVARAMAEGALAAAPVQIAVSVTGVAGPGQSERKPAGLVFIGCAVANHETEVVENRFNGDRGSVRRQTVSKALEILFNRVSAP